MKRFNIWALVAIVALIISVSTAGCTSNVANQTSNTVSPTSSVSQKMATYESGNFTIQYPSDWKNTTLVSKSVDTFTVSSGGSIVTVTSMNMSIGLKSYTDSRIGMLKNNSNYTLIESGNTTLAGNPAYKAVYTLNYQGISGKFMEIWTVKDGKIYQITYQATPGNYDANSETAQKMSDTFKIK